MSNEAAWEKTNLRSPSALKNGGGYHVAIVESRGKEQLASDWLK